VITRLHAEQRYPLQLLCEVLDYPRSSFYYRAHPRDDTAARAAIAEAQAQWPTYGYRRITVEASRGRAALNSKRVRRLRRLMKLQRKLKAKKRRTTNSRDPTKCGSPTSRGFTCGAKTSTWR